MRAPRFGMSHNDYGWSSGRPTLLLPSDDDLKAIAAQDAKQLDWDLFFLRMARLMSTRSKDPSTKVGAVIVDAAKTVIGLGYNGFPRGMDDSDERYADREFKYSRVVHGEMNAILNAGRSVMGATLYTTPFMPCDRCAVFVWQAGIARVVTTKADAATEARWADSFAKTAAIFDEAGIPVSILQLPE